MAANPCDSATFALFAAVGGAQTELGELKLSEKWVRLPTWNNHLLKMGRRNPRDGRGKHSPYWSTGPGGGLSCEGMKDQSALDAWSPALAQTMRELAPAASGRTVLKILERCAGCKSVSTAAALEARNFGIHDIQVFSIDGKPGTNCTRCEDILTYDWTCDDELHSFREEREEGVTYITYCHASPHCGPYSTLANRVRGRCRSVTCGGATQWCKSAWS